jgi:putative N6-adenine-specific DNA methylase
MNLPTARYHAKTLQGLEHLVAEELKEHGAIEIDKGRRGVNFTATAEAMYRHCLHARFTLRVLRQLHQFKAKTTDELYRLSARFAWEDVIKKDGTFTIDATIFSDDFPHSQFATFRLKDAIVDRFKGKTGERPSVNKVNPDVRIHLHISRNEVTLSIDASGEPLSKRGYRSRKAIAPLNEVLAAGLLALSGWRPGMTLYDPMCGSGTFTCEASLWASGLPVQLNRSHFSFMEWSSFNKEAWIKVREESMDYKLPVKSTIYASDISKDAISQTKYALSQLDLPDHDVSVDQIDFMTAEPEAEKDAFIVMNPPYGERMELDDIDSMYSQIGDRLKFHWPGFKAWIISSDPTALKNIGLRPNARIKVHNGPLECRWIGFDLYEGSRDDAKPQRSQQYDLGRKNPKSKRGPQIGRK